MLKLFANPADEFKIIASYIIGGLAIVFCILAAWTTSTGNAKYLQVLICVLGGSLGWIFGLFLTPSNEGEKKQFSEFGKALTALVSGFGLAQVNTLVEGVRTASQDMNTEATGIRVLLFSCTLLIGGLFTYISRLHVRGTDEELKGRREKVLSEVLESVEKLRRLN